MIWSASSTARICCRIGFALIALAFVRVHAADGAAPYPTRPILVVIPAPAGGALDIAFRAIRPALSIDLGMPMAIVNKPGASGIIGMESVALARPDGYTLAATSTSTLTVVNVPAPPVPYSLDDFIPIGNYARDVIAVVVPAGAPWHSLEELTSYAKRNPGKLIYGSGGTGTLSALNMEAIKDAFGLDIAQVPFPGAPQVTNAILGRQLEIGAVPLSSAAPLLRDDSLRALAITVTHRLASFSDIPTASEAGYRRALPALSIGLYAPAGTPRPAIDTLSQALRRTIGTASVIATIEKAGLVVQYEDGERVHDRLLSEYRDVMDLARKPAADPGLFPSSE